MNIKKNKDFFYLQYNQIEWKNQEKTKINSFINDYIIKNIILKHKEDTISLFDIGFGIGFFFKMVSKSLPKHYRAITLEGCEPSNVNYNHFITKKPRTASNTTIQTYKTNFQQVKTKTKFDFITAIYVFPHFVIDELEQVAQKIHAMLKTEGKFVLILANEKYLKEKLKSEKDLFIESSDIVYKNKKYKEVLHYSNIPKIGKVIDYNREERLYIDLFKNSNLKLIEKKILNDNGFICTLFVFEK